MSELIRMIILLILVIAIFDFNITITTKNNKVNITNEKEILKMEKKKRGKHNE